MTTTTDSPMFAIDGTDYDLTIPWVDVIGVTWRWTRGWNETGEPMMLAAGDHQPVPLPDVVRWHGPLIPIHPIDYQAWLHGDPDDDNEPWGWGVAS